MRVAAISLVIALLAGRCVAAENELPDGPDVFDFEAEPHLPPVPSLSSLTGAFVGGGRDTLIVAGGASRPHADPQPGLSSTPFREIYVLSEPRGPWSKAGRLPRPLAHGIALTVDEAVVCLGGSDGTRHRAEVFQLGWSGSKAEKLEVTDLPSMPRAAAFACGAVIEKTVYMAGGLEDPLDPGPLKTFWALDLSVRPEKRRWQDLPPWPGPPRTSAVAAAQDGAFFLFGGVTFDRHASSSQQENLHDAYRFDPKPRPGRWRRIADVPRDVKGTPFLAVPLGQSHIAVMGAPESEEATPAATPGESRPATADNVLCYHTITDTWITGGRYPAASTTDGGLPVRPGAAWWRDRLVIVGGQLDSDSSTSAVLWAKPKPVVKSVAWPDYAALATYLAALVGMGIYFSLREKSTADFFLGGHRIPWWAAGLSIFGTQLSAITFMAIPAVVYRTDWVYFPGAMMVAGMMPVIVFFYLPFYRRLGITSVYEYLEKRFNLGTRFLGSAAFVLFQLGRMGVVLYLPSLALSAVTGINIYLCIAAMGALATSYTVLGGIEAVIWTDVLQVVVLMGGALLSLVLIVMEVDGGVSGIVSAAGEAGKLKTVNLTWDVTTTALWLVIFGRAMEQLVSYTADQTVVQRYLTTPDEKSAARSIWTNGLLSIPAPTLFFCVGTALWAFYRTRPELLNPPGRTDEIFPWFVAGQLPAGVVGLVIAGLFAAAMSSLDSSMNSMATTITTDFYRRLKPDASDRTCLNLARALTVALGVIGTGCALYMAYIKSQSMYDQYTKIIGLFGGGLAGLFAVGIFTRRTHGIGVIVGFLASAVILFSVKEFTEIHFFLYPAIGIVSCFVIGYGVSLVIPTKQPDLKGLTIFTRRRMP